MCTLCVRVKISKHSFKPFCVWIFKKTTELTFWPSWMVQLPAVHTKNFTLVCWNISIITDKRQLHLPLFSLAMSLISISSWVSCNYGGGTGSQILSVAMQQQCKWEFPRHQLNGQTQQDSGTQTATCTHTHTKAQEKAVTEGKQIRPDSSWLRLWETEREREKKKDKSQNSVLIRTLDMCTP